MKRLLFILHKPKKSFYLCTCKAIITRCLTCQNTEKLNRYYILIEKYPYFIYKFLKLRILLTIIGKIKNYIIFKNVDFLNKKKKYFLIFVYIKHFTFT